MPRKSKHRIPEEKLELMKQIIQGYNVQTEGVPTVVEIGKRKTTPELSFPISTMLGAVSRINHGVR